MNEEKHFYGGNQFEEILIVYSLNILDITGIAIQYKTLCRFDTLYNAPLVLMSEVSKNTRSPFETE